MFVILCFVFNSSHVHPEVYAWRLLAQTNSAHAASDTLVRHAKHVVFMGKLKFMTVLDRALTISDECIPSCIHGYCATPGVCSCHTGYYGSRCEKGIWARTVSKITWNSYNVSAYCKQTCINGSCTAPGVCTCNSGYYGPTCDKSFKSALIGIQLVAHFFSYLQGILCSRNVFDSGNLLVQSRLRWIQMRPRSVSITLSRCRVPNLWFHCSILWEIMYSWNLCVSWKLHV